MTIYVNDSPEPEANEAQSSTPMYKKVLAIAALMVAISGAVVLKPTKTAIRSVAAQEMHCCLPPVCPPNCPPPR